jgi:hypothetical protein
MATPPGNVTECPDLTYHKQLKSPPYLCTGVRTVTLKQERISGWPFYDRCPIKNQYWMYSARAKVSIYTKNYQEVDKTGDN